tara:strand:+ start:984 stop:1205 length:222 start_codon:yes stop_codon:yes gene_type:complete
MIEFCRKLLNGEKMSTNSQLKKEINEQKETIVRLSDRVGVLVDRIAILENNIELFKGQVSNDLKKIVTRVRKM